MSLAFVKNMAMSLIAVGIEVLVADQVWVAVTEILRKAFPTKPAVGLAR